MRVLLVPSNFHYAEGAIARCIAQQCPEIDFYYFRAHDMSSRFHEFLNLARDVDVIHWMMNLSNISFPPGFDWKSIPCPSIASVYHVMDHEMRKIEFAQKADLIHVISTPWFKEIASKVVVPTALALGGTNYPLFSRHQQLKKQRRPFRFGMFGVLHKRKRVEFFRNALTCLNKKDFEVVFQGFGWEKEKTFFQEKGIKVRSLGPQPFAEAWKAYGEIDCYICSSEVEGGPLGILEALSSGVPVVSTNVGVAAEILSSGGGSVVSVDDHEGFAKALARMMDDPSYYAKCALEAGPIAARFFKNIPDGYLQMYKNVVQIWNQKNSQPWVFKAGPHIPVLNQREKELAVDLIKESLNLFKIGNFLSGFILWIKGLFSFKLNFFWVLKCLKFGLGEFVRKKYSAGRPVK